MTRFQAPPAEGPLPPRPAPTFSVVIPAYQAAATVAEAVRSALVQTLPPLEVIVCDDGSTDDLSAAVEPYRRQIVLLGGPHQGAAAAKNRGLYRARGEFVIFLDADDCMLPQCLQALAELASLRPDLDILATDALVEDAQGGGRGRWYQGMTFPVRDQRRAILERCFLLQHSAARRERLLAEDGFDPATEPAEDWDLWIRLILAGARAGLVDQPLARYRLRPDSLTAHRPRALRSRVVVLEKTCRHPALTGKERTALLRSLARYRQRAALAEAEEALRRRAPDARRRALAVALGRGFPLAGRGKALAAALAPTLAGRYLDRRERHRGRSSLDRSSPPA